VGFGEYLNIEGETMKEKKDEYEELRKAYNGYIGELKITIEIQKRTIKVLKEMVNDRDEGKWK